MRSSFHEVYSAAVHSSLRRLLASSVCVVTLCATLGGCGNSENAGAPLGRATTTSTAQIPAATATPHGAMPSSTPALSGTLARRADLAEGMALFQAQCEGCHSMFSAGISGPSQPVGPDLDGIGKLRQP